MHEKLPQIYKKVISRYYFVFFFINKIILVQ